MGANYIAGATGVGSDDIPQAASSPGGVVQSFELYESLDNLDTYIGAGYYNKGFGQWAYTSYGAGVWSDLSDFAQSEVNLSGGNGSGFRVLCRFEAWPGDGGNPTNTRYKIAAIIDGGTNYLAGDVLTFPDIGGKNISGAPSTGSGGISFRVATTSFGSDASAGAAYTHTASLHQMLPVDTQVSSNQNVAYPQVSNIVESTEPFNYDSDPTTHTHTINYTTGLTNYEINIPETFIAVDGMSASISIQAETDTKMVDYLIKT